MPLADRLELQGDSAHSPLEALIFAFADLREPLRCLLLQAPLLVPQWILAFRLAVNVMYEHSLQVLKRVSF